MRWIRHNLGYKLMALALSVTLWTYVQNIRGENQRTFEDAVETRNAPPGLLPHLPRETVRVTVSGPTHRLQNLSAEEVKTWVDLQDLRAGRSIVNVQCKTSEDADLLTCTPSPALLPVNMEPQVTRTLPIKVLVNGPPPLGYTFAKPQASPSSAVVRGRGKIVAQVEQLVASVTASPSKTGRGVDQNARVLPLDAGGGLVSAVEVAPPEVRVVSPLHLEPATKRLLVSPIPIGRPAEGFKVTAMAARPREVLARGEASALANLTGVHTRPVNLDGLNSTRTLRNIGLESIVGIDFEPETVSVRIEIQPLQGPSLRTSPSSSRTRRPATSAASPEVAR
ncbi:MAG: hypothetical protein KY468_09020 [Armatimonadetes bacterium]|nr:hypothetical protein [Armatimonadota bacterium]